MMSNVTNNTLTSVNQIKHLTPSTYIVRIERRELEFRAGQYILLGLPGYKNKREYSIYSGEMDPFIEVLIKEIQDGVVSKQLKEIRPGTKLVMDGPFGFFTLSPEQIETGKFLFIASGTGIAPFHSFVRSFAGLDYTILHGVRYLDEGYGKDDYDPKRYILCTTKDPEGNFHGRVTEYIKNHPVDNQTLCYLCGNSNMIHEMHDILTEQGVPNKNLHAEVYF